MSLIIASLNSGSNGNCYYIGNETDAVLVDIGISCREVEKRMKRIGLDVHKVKAVFLSHEHTDHISGVTGVAHKYNLPVYMTQKMLQQGRVPLKPHLAVVFPDQAVIAAGSLQIKPFAKHHDACDPHSFTVSGNEVTIGVFTDIGQVCDGLIFHFQQCHAAFLEANYDVQLLENGRYPHFLKNRIRGGKGHLSNEQALDLFINHRPSYMTHLLLSHLSKDNNDPALVENLFKQHAGNTEIIIASRFVETAVYEIHTSGAAAKAPVRKQAFQPQLSLF